MFKISNKPNLYKFLVDKIEKSDNKTMYKNSIVAIKKEKVFRNTNKLEEYLEKNLNFNLNSSSFLYELSSHIFEFSRRATQ